MEARVVLVDPLTFPELEVPGPTIDGSAIKEQRE